jgi:transcriptional regulator with XRE-family HTH domain
VGIVNTLCNWYDLIVTIKEAREAKGLSQSQLDALLRLAPGTFGRWERGAVTPTKRNQRRIAKALAVEVDDLGYGG